MVPASGTSLASLVVDGQVFTSRISTPLFDGAATYFSEDRAIVCHERIGLVDDHDAARAKERQRVEFRRMADHSAVDAGQNGAGKFGIGVAEQQCVEERIRACRLRNDSSPYRT